MRKTFLCIFSLCMFINKIGAQTVAVRDSLLQLVKTLPNDTNRVKTLNNLAFQYQLKKPDTTYLLGQQAYELSRSLNYLLGEAQALNVMAIALTNIGDDAKALKMYNQSKELNTLMNRPDGVAVALSNIADMYMQQGDWQKGLDEMKESYAIYSTLPANQQRSKSVFLSNIGECFYNLHQLDSATIYLNQALAADKIDRRGAITTVLFLLGDVAFAENNINKAYSYYQQSIAASIELESYSDLYQAYYRMAKLFQKNNQQDSALYYAKQAVSFAEQSTYTRGVLKGSQYLSALYEGKNDAEALRYFKVANAARDSLYSQDKMKQLLSLSFEEKEKAQQIEAGKMEYKNAVRLYVLVSILLVFGVFAIFLVRNNRQKQKANYLLQNQKEDINSKAKELLLQKENLEQSYSNVERLGEIGRKITASLSVEAIIGTAYDNVNALMDASVFGIGIYHDEKKSIDFPATYEKSQALPPYSNSIYDENRLAAVCFNSGKEIVIGNLHTEFHQYLKHVPDPAHGDQPLSLIYLPLNVNEKMLGVITVQSFKEDAFSDYHLYMLRNISIYAAIAIENAESFNKLNVTVDSLKYTQKQLIQSEKMASLGELTAGIAHEIQNPLNFVNNFSEVNYELIEELQGERLKVNGERNENLENEILVDLKKNLEKINHHGKRADAIVKGMLQHSRSSSGIKEPTNINALAAEYLRLAFHGLRAKDKDFNTILNTNYDQSIGTINIIPQDIGRVLLNLINNAFYAVAEKNASTGLPCLPDRQAAGQAGSAGQQFEPTVSVSTKKIVDKFDSYRIEISVADNGNGIPQKVLDKIFQPFFTTKPTGQGTGLGLSLSYDIVKAHGGEIKVVTTENKGTEFIIQLPMIERTE
jgi:signal transduction histidine kinase